MKTQRKIDPRKALEAFKELQIAGLGDRFKGMAKDQILKALKKTREEIWREKLAARPRH